MRLFGFILRLAVAVGLVVWLALSPGTARIVWHDYVIDTSAAVLILALLAVAFVVATFYRVWRFVKDGPTVWRLRKMLRRQKQGQDFLTQGLVAIAAGDAVEAGRLAVASRRLLGATTATRLLQAQAAQLAGDHRVAHDIFLALAAAPDSAVLGYRGLIMAALREQKWDEADQQIEKLRRLKPKTPWLALVQFEMATRRHRWREAGEALAQATAARLLDAPRAKRHKAALLLAASGTETSQGRHDRALPLAEQAHHQAPDWLPAVIALAEAQRATGHDRAARRTIEKTWGATPHAPLATLYGAMNRNDGALDAYKQIERLTRAQPDHTVSRMAMAEAALAADLWGEARRHLLALAQRKDATQAVFRCLAKLERRESGNEPAAAQWLMKAAEALPDPRWLCTRCGGAHDAWRPLCASCGAFNSLEWQTPGVSRYAGHADLSSPALEFLS